MSWKINIVDLFAVFFQNIVEAVQIKIPHNAKQMYEAIQDVVDGFAELFDDPKTSLAAIGKGVIT